MIKKAIRTYKEILKADIRFRRGKLSNIKTLKESEPGFSIDEKSLYIGSSDGNIRFINEEQIKGLHYMKEETYNATEIDAIVNGVATPKEAFTQNYLEDDWVANAENTSFNIEVAHNKNINMNGLNVKFYQNSEAVMFSYTYVDENNISVHSDTREVFTIVITDCNAIGPKGEKGEIGAVGPVGPKGEQGEVGPQGEPGAASEYVLPPASIDTLGGIKVGANLSVDENGVLNAYASGGSSCTSDFGEFIVPQDGFIPPVGYDATKPHVIFSYNIGNTFIVESPTYGGALSGTKHWKKPTDNNLNFGGIQTYAGSSYKNNYIIKNNVFYDKDELKNDISEFFAMFSKNTSFVAYALPYEQQQAGATTKDLAEYVGKPKQLVVNTEDYSLHVMDGKTKGGHKLGLTGPQGEQGIQGEVGPQGPQGEPGTSIDAYNKDEVNKMLQDLADSIGGGVNPPKPPPEPTETILKEFNSLNNKLEVDYSVKGNLDNLNIYGKSEVIKYNYWNKERSTGFNSSGICELHKWANVTSCIITGLIPSKKYMIKYDLVLLSGGFDAQSKFSLNKEGASNHSGKTLTYNVGENISYHKGLEGNYFLSYTAYGGSNIGISNVIVTEVDENNKPIVTRDTLTNVGTINNKGLKLPKSVNGDFIYLQWVYNGKTWSKLATDMTSTDINAVKLFNVYNPVGYPNSIDVKDFSTSNFAPHSTMSMSSYAFSIISNNHKFENKLRELGVTISKVEYVKNSIDLVGEPSLNNLLFDKTYTDTAVFDDANNTFTNTSKGNFLIGKANLIPDATYTLYLEAGENPDNEISVELVENNTSISAMTNNTLTGNGQIKATFTVNKACEANIKVTCGLSVGLVVKDAMVIAGTHEEDLLSMKAKLRARDPRATIDYIKDNYSVAIPSEITGGLKAIGDVKDEFILKNNLFKKCIGSRDYVAGDESNSALLTDKTTTYYVLDAPELIMIESPVIKSYNYGTKLELLGTIKGSFKAKILCDLEILNKLIKSIKISCTGMNGYNQFLLSEIKLSLGESVLDISKAKITSNTQLYIPYEFSNIVDGNLNTSGGVKSETSGIFYFLFELNKGLEIDKIGLSFFNGAMYNYKELAIEMTTFAGNTFTVLEPTDTTPIRNDYVYFDVIMPKPTISALLKQNLELKSKQDKLIDILTEVVGAITINGSDAILNKLSMIK